jgi:hypothetical protein
VLELENRRRELADGTGLTVVEGANNLYFREIEEQEFRNRVSSKE